MERMESDSIDEKRRSISYESFDDVILTHSGDSEDNAKRSFGFNFNNPTNFIPMPYETMDLARFADSVEEERESTSVEEVESVIVDADADKDISFQEGMLDEQEDVILLETIEADTEGVTRVSTKPSKNSIVLEGLETIYGSTGVSRDKVLRSANMAFKRHGLESLVSGRVKYNQGKKEKIGPGNSTDDLPIFVDNLTQYICKPYMEKARIIVQKRKNNMANGEKGKTGGFTFTSPFQPFKDNQIVVQERFVGKICIENKDKELG